MTAADPVFVAPGQPTRRPAPTVIPTLYTRECRRCGAELKTLTPTGPLPRHGIYRIRRDGQKAVPYETDQPCTPTSKEN